MRLAKRMFLFFRQLLVLAPLAVDFLALLRRHLLELLIARPDFGTLLWFEAGPLLHPRLQTLLLLRTHLRVPLGDLDPLVATLGFDVSPVVGKWGEDTLLLGRELRPLRPAGWRARLDRVRDPCKQQNEREYGR